jgi:acetyl esterase/lipase
VPAPSDPYGVLMSETVYPWQAPFVCNVAPADPERHGGWDLYVRADSAPRPVVVFVHGGPLPALPVPPREWPVYCGYGTLAAEAGLVGVTVDHSLHGSADYPAALADVRAAIDGARADRRVDADRVAVWAFSGGSPLVAPFLQDPPDWLKSVALTYPVLDDVPERRLPAGFRPVEALTTSSVPITLTRVGREAPSVSAGVTNFLARAEQLGVRINVIDVPDGHHGFDALPPVAGATQAVHSAIKAVAATLTVTAG